MKLLHIADISFLTSLEHLVGEELDVVDRTDHIVRDSSMQHLHHLIFLTLFLKLQVISHVAYQHKHAHKVFVEKRLFADKEVAHTFFFRIGVWVQWSYKH